MGEEEEEEEDEERREGRRCLCVIFNGLGVLSLSVALYIDE